MERLLKGENKLASFQLQGDLLVVTDKRVIYGNNNDAFIGIENIRSANYRHDNCRIYKRNLDAKAITTLVAIIVFILAFGYNIYVLPEDTIASILSILFGSFIIYAIVMVTSVCVYTTISIINLLNSKICRVVILEITLNDGSFWLNRMYELNFQNDIERLSMQINNLRYE